MGIFKLRVLYFSTYLYSFVFFLIIYCTYIICVYALIVLLNNLVSITIPKFQRIKDAESD